MSRSPRGGVLALDVRLEGAKLVAPEGLALLEPRAHPRERLRAEAVLAAARVVLAGRLLDQARPAQNAEVAARRRPAERQRRRDIARPARLLAEQPDHREARRIA